MLIFQQFATMKSCWKTYQGLNKNHNLTVIKQAFHDYENRAHTFQVIQVIQFYWNRDIDIIFAKK